METMILCISLMMLIAVLLIIKLTKVTVHTRRRSKIEKALTSKH